MFGILGLSAAEQAAYERLLIHPGAPGAEPGPILERLVELGLVEPDRHRPLPPGEALETLLAARERELLTARQAVVALDERYRRGAPPPDASAAVEVVHGTREVTRRIDRILTEAPGLVRCIETPPYLAGEPAVDRARGGLGYRVLYDRRAYRPIPEVDARIGDAPARLLLTDQPIALLALHADPRRPPDAVLVRDPALLAALSALFELAWERAVPISPRGGATEFDRTLLPLLVAGLTDQEIADKLGWSHRTVRRRVRDLMTRLGAETRFQAGYHAVERGWLRGNEHDGP